VEARSGIHGATDCQNTAGCNEGRGLASGVGGNDVRALEGVCAGRGGGADRDKEIDLYAIGDWIVIEPLNEEASLVGRQICKVDSLPRGSGRGCDGRCQGEDGVVVLQVELEPAHRGQAGRKADGENEARAGSRGGIRQRQCGRLSARRAGEVCRSEQEES
jgi:hypothetical protein